MSTQAPTFTTTSWLSQVTAADPEFYQWPIAYEFSRGRVFRKNEADWYADLGSGIPDGTVLMGDDYLKIGEDYVTVEDV